MASKKNQPALTFTPWLAMIDGKWVDVRPPVDRRMKPGNGFRNRGNDRRAVRARKLVSWRSA